MQTPNPMLVACPRCKAPPNQPCVSIGTPGPPDDTTTLKPIQLSSPHTMRVSAARAAQGAAAPSPQPEPEPVPGPVPPAAPEADPKA